MRAECYLQLEILRASVICHILFLFFCNDNGYVELTGCSISLGGNDNGATKYKGI